MQRRDMLKVIVGSAAGLALGGRKALADPCPPPLSAGGLGWGVVPNEVAFQSGTDPITGWTVPVHDGVPSYKVLEIFLLGGCSVWDTFCTQLNAWNAPNLFSAEHNAAGCGATAPGGDNRITFMPGPPSWKIAPALRPLVMNLPYPGRMGGVTTSLFRHMRILPVGHMDAAHDLAGALMLNGLPRTSPRMTSTGAAIARRFGAADRPRSWVLQPRFHFGTAQQYSDATGQLPSSTRPIVVSLDGAGDLAARLSRNHFGGAALSASAHDALLQAYRGQYRVAAAPPGCPDPLRSAGLSAYENAADALPQGVTLASTFAGVTVANNLPSSAAPFCRPLAPAFGGDPVTQRSNGPRVALDLAVNLLADGTDRVRHVLVFDTGIVNRGLAYDSHDHLADDTDNNINSTMSKLAEHIASGALDLRTTIVVINTEFGRTAAFQNPGTSGGRNHRPEASWSVVIGGPTIGPFVWRVRRHAQ
jgi:hypothetical protein